MTSFLLNLLAIFLVVIFQVSFISASPWPINNINLILCLVIFFAVLINYQKALWWAFGGGLLMELFSQNFFGLITLGLIITAVILNILFNNFFTNRSFYSLLILGVIGVIGYNLLKTILGFLLIILGFKFNFYQLSFSSLFFWQPFLNSLILIVIFFTFQFSSNRLKNIFLPKNF